MRAAKTLGATLAWALLFAAPLAAGRDGEVFRAKERHPPGRHLHHPSKHRVVHHVHRFRPGMRVYHLPPRHHRIHYHGRDYFYFGGLFFVRPSAYYEVVPPPIGVRVPWLPPGYVSFVLGPHRYFYFNSTFFLWDPRGREYVVVEAPEGADEALAAAAEGEWGSGEVYAYPARGQSPEERDRDYYDCHLWAVDQADYDPTLERQNVARARDYRRALVACLEGRGYSVR
ncbi:MAG: hypothetical protein KatS3mg124_0984 [Porticoccaceae bacterium]|nr:MAG: hypothetical protein KatS3mg124_0984 [Porticoccaceae bacterium]